MLLLVALPLLCFLVIMAALCVAHLVEMQERRKKRERARLRLLAEPPLPPPRPPRAKPFAVMFIVDAFEPETAVLWETQVAALQRIAAAGAAGLELETLRPCYLSSARHYPELYDGTSFETWLEFLEDAELIGRTPSRVTITAVGTDFLKCRVAVHARA